MPLCALIKSGASRHSSSSGFPVDGINKQTRTNHAAFPAGAGGRCLWHRHHRIHHHGPAHAGRGRSGHQHPDRRHAHLALRGGRGGGRAAADHRHAPLAAQTAADGADAHLHRRQRRRRAGAWLRLADGRARAHLPHARHLLWRGRRGGHGPGAGRKARFGHRADVLGPDAGHAAGRAGRCVDRPAVGLARLVLGGGAGRRGGAGDSGRLRAARSRPAGGGAALSRTGRAAPPAGLAGLGHHGVRLCRRVRALHLHRAAAAPGHAHERRLAGSPPRCCCSVPVWRPATCWAAGWRTRA